MACFSLWHNLWNRALELGVGIMASFCLSNIWTLGDKYLVGQGQQSVEPQPQELGKSSQHTVLKGQPTSHNWGLDGKRKLHLSKNLPWDLALAAGSLGRNEKCWPPAPLERKAFQLGAEGRKSPLFWAAEVYGRVSPSQRWKEKEREWSWFTYYRLLNFLLNYHVFFFEDISLFFPLKTACILDLLITCISFCLFCYIY